MENLKVLNIKLEILFLLGEMPKKFYLVQNLLKHLVPCQCFLFYFYLFILMINGKKTFN